MRVPGEAIDILRDVHEVFAFVSDVTNDVRWHTTAIEGRRVSDGPIGLGTRFEGTYDSRRHTLETPSDPSNFQPLAATITGFVPDQALRTHVEFTGPLRGIGARMLGRASRTRLMRSFELSLMGAWRVLWPLAAFSARRHRAAEVEAVRRLLEPASRGALFEERT